MAAELGYHPGMGRRISATVAVLGLVLLAGAAAAQVNGVPASVTSMGFGGHFSPGVPASITSLGPNGFQGTRTSFFTQPTCCANRFFSTGRQPGNFHHHRGQLFFPGVVPVYPLPYTPVVIVPESSEQVDQEPQEDYRGGPTIFDRRGSGEYDRERYRDQSQERTAPSDQSTTASPVPVSEQAPTVLVFKDGHTVEVQNYAILGSLIYDLTPGHPRKIPLGDLDLEATAKQNDDRGIDFRLPAVN